MFEVVAIIIGLLDFLSTWRFFLAVGIAIAAGAWVMVLFPAGFPRVTVLALTVLIGAVIGWAWQLHHEKYIRLKRGEPK